MYKKPIFYLLLSLVLTGIIGAAGCATPATVSEDEAPETSTGTPAWMDIELTDVRTGEIFTVNQFKGKPVLLENFAVWCPTCLTQQKQIDKLLQLEGDRIVHISIDTDPNEDAAKVLGHVEKYGFKWYFAVSPIEMTRALIDDFGLTIVSAPMAPIVLINADQTARLLPNGVKSAEELLAEIEKDSR